jgi:hypothetical protein
MQVQYITPTHTPTPTQTPQPTPTPTLTPTPTPASSSIVKAASVSKVVKIYEGEIYSWLQEGGWEESLIQEAASVADCESHHHPDSANGNQLGLFQIMDEVGKPGEDGYWKGWWKTYGYDSSRYDDPIYNASLARKVYQYDIDHGYPPWNQWGCKP